MRILFGLEGLGDLGGRLLIENQFDLGDGEEKGSFS